MHVLEILKKLNLSEENSGAGSGTEWLECRGAPLESVSPVDGRVMGRVVQASRADYDRIVERAVSAFQAWRQVPAPRRGQVVRRMGDAMRRYKQDLGTLLSLEVGKIRSEAEGEIQEMIDMADFAVGQSRMLYGVTLPSERPGHRMYEQWHPLGPIGVITAFNFPVAVWAWNAMIALVAGDTAVWKPSSKAPLTSLATLKIMGGVLKEENLPEGILNVLVGGGQDVGEWMASDSRLPLVSATGSVAMGRRVAQAVSGRLGRSLLELGGNNAIIVTPEADLSLAVRAITFGAVGTAGQRCTTTRRVIVQRGILSTLAEALTGAYRKVRIGNPLDEGVLMGPLIDGEAVAGMQEALEALKGQGGRVLYGGEILTGGIFDAGTYVRPALCQAPPNAPIVREETFAPILYLIPYDTLEEALDLHNGVPQGLSSAIFTNNLREAEYFLSHRGSDCGIANVNIGTSGAEIGGAFGGEKDTGGGREAGSDAWKAYMRRQTTTINGSGDMPLAQGVKFEVE